MTPFRFLIPLIAALLLTSGCSGEPDALDEEPVATPAPDPAEGGIALGSAADLISVSDDMDSQLASLTGAAPKDEPGISAAPERNEVRAEKPPKPVDAGLGVSGGWTISATQIKGTVRQNQGSVRACYERELKSSPTMRGKVVVGWTIGADGKVRSPKIVQNNTGNRDMLPCIRRAIKSWRFPKAASPQDIEYPFVFKPKDY